MKKNLSTLVAVFVLVMSAFAKTNSEAIGGEDDKWIQFPVAVPPMQSNRMYLDGGLGVHDIEVELTRDCKILFRYISQTNNIQAGFAFGTERYQDGLLNGVSMFRSGLLTTFCATFTNGVASGPYSGTHGGNVYRGIMADGKIITGVTWDLKPVATNALEYIAYSNSTVVGRAHNITALSNHIAQSAIPRLEFDMDQGQLDEAYGKMNDGDGGSAFLLYQHSCYLTNKRLLSDLLLAASAQLGCRDAAAIYKALSGKPLYRLGFSELALEKLRTGDKTAYLMVLDFAHAIHRDDYAAAGTILSKLEDRGIDGLVVAELKKMLRTEGDYYTIEGWANILEQNALSR